MSRISRDPNKILEEARKGGGWPIYDATGAVVLVPEKVMRCPQCGGKVMRITRGRHWERTTPEGLPKYTCKDCNIEFAQTSKEYFCTHFKRHIKTSDCRRCPVGKPHIAAWRKRVMRGEDVDPNESPCPFLQNRVGMDWTPEGWDRDNQIK